MKGLAGVGMGAMKLFSGGGTGGDAVFGDISKYTPKTDMGSMDWNAMEDFTSGLTGITYGN